MTYIQYWCSSFAYY